MRNFDSSGSPILTEKAKSSFLTFVELCTFDNLGNGMRNLILIYLLYEDGRALWFNTFLEEARLFYDFLDDLREEYSGI